MIVLDTNVVSELMKPTPDAAVANWLARLTDPALATTAVTVSEIAYGLHRLPAGRRRQGLTDRFAAFVGGTGGLPVLDLTEAVGRELISSHCSGLMIDAKSCD